MFFPLWNHCTAAMCRNLTNVICIITNVPVKTCQCTLTRPWVTACLTYRFFQRLTGTWRHRDPRPNVPPRRQCCAAWLRHSLPCWTDDRLLAWRVADVHLHEHHIMNLNPNLCWRIYNYSNWCSLQNVDLSISNFMLRYLSISLWGVFLQEMLLPSMCTPQVTAKYLLHRFWKTTVVDIQSLV